jgi:Domain of Unknown Function (DUF1080)
MKRFLAALLVFSLAVTLSFAEDKKDDKKEAKDDGFKTIFDGKSMDGWKVNESKESFSLKDGAIVANGNRSHCFYVGDDKPFKNFVLDLEVLTKPKSNGGVYFHTKFQDEGWPAQGHECQVNNAPDKDPQKTGGVYNVKKVLAPPAKDDTWFKYTIIVEGTHVVTKIDGKVVAEYTEDAAALDKDSKIEKTRRIGSGTFALQAHDPGSTVMYRNIRVKRLGE